MLSRTEIRLNVAKLTAFEILKIRLHLSKKGKKTVQLPELPINLIILLIKLDLKMCHKAANSDLR